MRGRRLVRVAAVMVLVAGALVALPGATRSASAVSAGDWWGGVATFPANHTVGTSLYRGGTWSYTDRYGDATGANADGKHREEYFGAVPAVGQDLTYDFFGAHRLANNGDAELPSNNTATPVGSADIIFFQARPAAEGLQVRVVFAALGSGTILTLGIDADGAHSAATPFPHNAALACGSCGIDRFVTVWNGGGDVQDGQGHALGAPTRVVADLGVNAVDFVVPTALLGSTTPSWRLWLAAGVNDGAGSYSGFNGNQATGSPRTSSDARTGVFDLAFSPDDRRTVDDRVQADLLATGDAAPASAMLDVFALASGVDRLDGMPKSGPLEQILVSSLNLGEGTDNGTNSATYQVPEPGSVYHYLGRLQPYLVLLPSSYDPGRPASTAINLHGYNGYYDESYYELQSFPRPTPPDGLVARLDRAGMIGVFPLGRGDIQYNRDGEKDVLEVIADAAAHFAVDPARLHLFGLSMGGAGTWQIAEHHPDLFADIAPALPNTFADTLSAEVVQAQGLGIPLPPISQLSPQAGVADEDALPNLRNVPTFVFTAIGDTDAGVVARLYYGDLRDLPAEAHIKTLLRQTHSFDVIRTSYDELFEFWARHRLATTPARVTYVDHTSWSYPQFGVVDDSAYWLHGLRPVVTDAQGGGIGRIDADALTLPRLNTASAETTSTGGDPASGTLYLRSDSLPVAVAPRPVSNAVSVTTVNLSAAGADISRLAVDFTRPYCVLAGTDRAVDLTLSAVALSSAEVTGVTAMRVPGGLLLKLPAGASRAVVRAAGVRSSPADPCAGVAAADTRTPTSTAPNSLPNTAITVPSLAALAGGVVSLLSAFATYGLVRRTTSQEAPAKITLIPGRDQATRGDERFGG